MKDWLRALTKNGTPIHICLTHADELYAECKAEGKVENIAEELKVSNRCLWCFIYTLLLFTHKQRIRSQFKLDSHHTREIHFYSFHHASDVSDEELKKCGINSEVEVGDWLVHILRNRFKQDDLAEKLKRFFQN